MIRITCLLTALATPALAQDPAPLPLTYETFEAAVPHVDMELCPVDLAGEGRFCRLVLLSEQIQVFVFSEEGDQPMIAYQAWPAELMNGLLD